MKLQTSKKQVLKSFYKVISVPYCEAQNLLNCHSPFAYSAGIYGWSCDYYQFGNVCISTGYSPIGTPVNYDLLRELELKAEKLRSDYSVNYKDLTEKLDELITELINSVK